MAAGSPPLGYRIASSIMLRQHLTRSRRSQPHRSCKRNDTKPDCDSAIGQHLLENDQCALNYDNKRFLILAAARSFFHLNRLGLRGCLYQDPAPGAMQTERVRSHSQTLDNRSVFIWLLAAFSLAFL